MLGCDVATFFSQISMLKQLRVPSGVEISLYLLSDSGIPINPYM